MRRKWIIGKIRNEEKKRKWAIDQRRKKGRKETCILRFVKNAKYTKESREGK